MTHTIIRKELLSIYLPHIATFSKSFIRSSGSQSLNVKRINRKFEIYQLSFLFCFSMKQQLKKWKCLFRQLYKRDKRALRIARINKTIKSIQQQHKLLLRKFNHHCKLKENVFQILHQYSELPQQSVQLNKLVTMNKSMLNEQILKTYGQVRSHYCLVRLMQKSKVSSQQKLKIESLKQAIQQKRKELDCFFRLVQICQQIDENEAILMGFLNQGQQGLEKLKEILNDPKYLSVLDETHVVAVFKSFYQLLRMMLLKNLIQKQEIIIRLNGPDPLTSSIQQVQCLYAQSIPQKCDFSKQLNVVNLILKQNQSPFTLLLSSSTGQNIEALFVANSLLEQYCLLIYFVSSAAFEIPSQNSEVVFLQ